MIQMVKKSFQVKTFRETSDDEVVKEYGLHEEVGVKESKQQGYVSDDTLKSYDPFGIYHILNNEKKVCMTM